MISVPADISGQSKHAADWLDGRKEQGPSPVLARAKRQLEELEVDWADAFAVPETESVTVPRPKKKRTEEPAATSHLPPAISASHTAKPPHPPGKVLAQKTADQQLLAQAAHRVQRQAEQAKKKEDEAKKKKKEEDEKGKKKEEDEEEKRKKNPVCALQGIAARWLSAHYKTIARSIARAMARGLGFVTPCPNKHGKNAYFSKVSDSSGTASDAVNVREDCKHVGPPLWVVPVEERGPFGGPS